MSDIEMTIIHLTLEKIHAMQIKCFQAFICLLAKQGSQIPNIYNNKIRYYDISIHPGTIVRYKYVIA